MKGIILTFLTLLLNYFTLLADGTLMSWGMNDLQGMTEEKFNNAKTWSMEEALQKNIDAQTWPEAYLVAVAASSKKDKIIDRLIEQLENQVTTKLRLTSRLIIWERILSNDILFEGKGLQVEDDLFSVAGRANWILRNITGKSFGYVKPNSKEEDLKELKEKWQQWRKGKKVDEYINLYDSKEKGLDETHSLIAFEALVYSLKPSSEKESLTKDCLKRVYHLDELPKEPGSPASYCNPDTYTFFYLGALIGEKKSDENRGYEWWSKWWNENKEKLKWNSEKGIFEVSI